MLSPCPLKLAIVLWLLFCAIVSNAQTVTLLKGETAEGQNPATKLVSVDISILNNKTAPISFNNAFFALTDHAQNVYDSLSGLYKSDVSFHVDLNPGLEISKKLWFEVPATLDPQTLRLSMHQRESKNWDDYLEIPLARPGTATAPMWHAFHPGAVMDSLTYSVFSAGTNHKELTPPKLVHSVDPKLPPEAEATIRGLKDRKAVETLSLIVDTQGNPQQIELVSAPLGMGLDAEALRVVKQFRFKPALDKNGVPVAVKVNIQESFRAY
jgi:TonB family protein